MRKLLKVWLLIEASHLLWSLFYEAYHIYYCFPANRRMGRRFALYTYLPNPYAWTEIWDNPDW